jgi:hypothetical protein
MHLKQALRYVMRLYRRWKYLRTPRPVFEPTVTPVERHWTATDEKLERGLYLANPNAFWLRPDRHEHKVPCWQIEGFWVEPLRTNTATTGFAGWIVETNLDLMQRRYGGYEARQAAMYDAAMAQNRYMNYVANSENYAGLQNQQASLNRLGGNLANLLSPLNQRN